MRHFFTCLILAGIISSGSILLSQDSYEIYVSDRGNNAVKKYDMDGNYLGNFVSPGDGGLSTTEDILFHPDGTVLVSGFGNNVIKRYEGATGDYLGDFSSGYSLVSPSKMSIGPDSLIYITQWGSTQNKVVRFDLDGNFVDEFTSTGVSNGLGHVWDEDGNFYIAAYGSGSNGTVLKFDAEGNALGIFVNTAILQGPTGIWWDVNGDLLVEDWIQGTVLRYDPDGNYVNTYLTGMTNPEGIAVLPNGDMLIGDWGQDAVHRFSSAGDYLGLFTNGNGLTDPNSVKMRTVTMTTVPQADHAVSFFHTYPTVSRGVLHIEFEGHDPYGIRIQITDIKGSIIDNIQPSDNDPGPNRLNWKADASLENGVYLVTLWTGKGKITSRFLLKR